MQEHHEDLGRLIVCRVNFMSSLSPLTLCRRWKTVRRLQKERYAPRLCEIILEAIILQQGENAYSASFMEVSKFLVRSLH